MDTLRNALLRLTKILSLRSKANLHSVERDKIIVVILLPEKTIDRHHRQSVDARAAGLHQGVTDYLVDTGYVDKDNLTIMHITNGWEALHFFKGLNAGGLKRSHLISGAKFDDGVGVVQLTNELKAAGALPHTLVCTLPHKLDVSKLPRGVGFIGAIDTAVAGAEIAKKVSGDPLLRHRPASVERSVSFPVPRIAA